MADNFDATPGVGATFGMDEVNDGTLGVVKVGYGKIMDGTINGTNKMTVNAGGEALVKDTTGQGSLASIDGKITACNTGAVAGTVTANLSAVDNAVLDVIAAKDYATQTTLAAINTKLVTGTDIGDVTINNAAGAAAVNIQDGGNTITVDGTVATTSAANTTATGIIDALNETVECTVSPGASTVGVQLQGTWAAAGDLVAFEATIDGVLWVSCYANLTSEGSIAVKVSGSNGLYQMAAAGYAKVRVRGSTWGAPGSCTVDFNSTVGSSASLLALPLPAGDNNIGNVDVTTLPAVTGTVTAELSAVDNAVLDVIAAKDFATEVTLGTVHGHVDSIDGKITACNTGAVAGTVTANLSAVDNAVLDVIAAKDYATQTTLAALNAKLVTGTVIGDVNLGAVDNAVLDVIAAKDFATQTTLAALNAKMVTGTDIGDVTINNAAGAAAVNIQDGGNTITVDGTVAVTNADITDSKTALQLLDNAVDGAYLNTNMNIAGTDVAANNGVVSAQTQRVTIASDSTGVIGHNITGIGHGVKTVTTAGTDVALAASTPCKRVTVQAQTDNTNIIAVGGTGVDATIATGTGIVLYPGDAYEIDVDNLADVFIDSLVNGEGVRFAYLT